MKPTNGDGERRANNPQPKGEIRSLTTDAAILTTPTLAVVANQVGNYLQRPKAPPPPNVELPPGVDRR
jgi:hypothetical protein